MKSLMAHGVKNDFKVLSYELIYELESVWKLWLK
jgi:hypothetical protein